MSETRRLTAKEEYDGLLKSGMFFEFYPQLTGEYSKDKVEWKREKRKIDKMRKVSEWDGENM